MLMLDPRRPNISTSATALIKIKNSEELAFCFPQTRFSKTQTLKTRNLDENFWTQLKMKKTQTIGFFYRWRGEWQSS